ncbi:MAG: hypothetical protein ABW224_12035 [Kibdelosporangium sp.]
MGERDDYEVRYETLRSAVELDVIMFVLMAVPLFVFLLVDGRIEALPVILGMLVYCLVVFGVALFAESRKHRGLRGKVRFRVDEIGIYFGDPAEQVPWRRVREVVLRRDSEGLGPALADLTVVCAEPEAYRIYVHADRRKLRAAVRRHAPDVLLTDNVVVDPVPAVKKVKRRKRDR